jgi:hypothetical protein
MRPGRGPHICVYNAIAPSLAHRQRLRRTLMVKRTARRKCAEMPLQVCPRILGTHGHRLSANAREQLALQPNVSCPFACPFVPDQTIQAVRMALGIFLRTVGNWDAGSHPRRKFQVPPVCGVELGRPDGGVLVGRPVSVCLAVPEGRQIEIRKRRRMRVPEGRHIVAHRLNGGCDGRYFRASEGRHTGVGLSRPSGAGPCAHKSPPLKRWAMMLRP